MALTADMARELLVYDPGTGDLRWRVNRRPAKAGDIAGHLTPRGYRRVKVGQYFYAHRLIWLMVYGAWPTNEVDHIDRDPKNNRLTNLRLASRTDQCGNKRGWSESGLKGVSRNRNGYAARIYRDGVLTHLGTHPTPEQAHAAYCEAGRKLYGEFFCDGAAA